MRDIIEDYRRQEQREIEDLAKHMPDNSILIRATSADNNTIIQNNYTVNFNLTEITEKLIQLHTIDPPLAWGLIEVLKSQNILDIKKNKS